MPPVDIARSVARGLGRRMVQTALNALVVLCGVGSTVLVVAVAHGVSTAAGATIQGLGPDVVVVYPSGVSSSGVQIGLGSGSSLTTDDVRALSDVGFVPDAVAVVPTAAQRGPVSALERTRTTDLIGASEGFAAVRGYGLASGAFFSSSDVAAGSSVVVVGQAVADTVFAGADPVGRTVRIANHQFRVVGSFAARGYSGSANLDDLAVMPLSTLRSFVLANSAPGIQQILVQASSNKTTAAVRDEITSTLLTRHRITDPALADFQVRTQQDLVASADRLGTVMKWMLFLFASISLLAGMIGVVSQMLAGVRERSHEIGIRRAVGASSFSILIQFLAEALVIAVAGGVAGVAAGVAASRWLGSFVTDLPQPQVTLNAVIAATGAALFVGSVAGAYPALRAARLQPADAIRT